MIDKYVDRLVKLADKICNLRDITVSADYSAICGYTDQDVEQVFAPELPGLDREEIRRWYNGYNWTGTSVYNPFDLLLLFDKREFHPYWFETGTPTFLIDVLTQRGVFTPQLQAFVAQENLLGSFDVEQMTTEALLFQTGYLTVGSVWRIPGRAEFTLKYPNLEVIMAPTTVGIQAAAKAMQDENLCGKVGVSGLGLPSEMAGAVASGATKSFAIWNPIDLGYAATMLAYNLNAGTATAAPGAEIPMGRMGEAEEVARAIVWLASRVHAQPRTDVPQPSPSQ